MDGMEHGGEGLARAVENAYRSGQSDYDLTPLVRTDAAGTAVGLIAPGDAAVFCCRRGEREIELTEMFTEPDFNKVARRFLPGLDFSILTLYHEKFKDLPVAFAPERVVRPLAQAVAEAGRSQAHIAESEKYAHVTFFLNGGYHQPFEGEEDVCIPSPKGVPFYTVPALSLPQVADAVIARLGEKDLIVANFANGDVIGHTADREAKLTAAACVDTALDRVVKAALDKGYAVFVTADHGNIETLTTKSGAPHVAHTSNPVYFFALDGARGLGVSPRGALCDVAPTVLAVMGIPKPPEMTGDSLLAGQPFDAPKKVLLLILDGWGKGTGDGNDAIHLADTPCWDGLVSGMPFALLDASGESVGLSRGKTGNSEAGHMNLGAGRVVAQDDQRLEQAIQSGAFERNPVFVRQVREAKERGARLHLIAYLTHASSHGSVDYPLALCRLAKAEGLERVCLHIIFDGRSTEPGSAPRLLRELDGELSKTGVGQIVDGVGRGIALDRDGNYLKVKRAYDAMVEGKGTAYTA